PSARAAQTGSATTTTVHSTSIIIIYRPLHNTMLRIEPAATATVGVSSITTHKCVNDLHSRCFNDEWLRSTFEPARTGRHGRRRHRTEFCGRQSVVCDLAANYPGRQTCLPSLFATTITVSTPLVSPSISTKCLHDNQNFHAVAFTVDSVHTCCFVYGHHRYCSDTSAVDSSVTNSISVVSRSSDAAGTTNSSSRTVGYRPSTTCSDLEGTEDIGMVLRRSLVAGISGSAAINLTRDIPGKGFIRSQVPLLPQRPNGQGAYKCSSALCLRSVSAGCRTKAGTTDASVRVCGSSGGVLHRCDERHCTSQRWRRGGRETEQGQSTETQGASVGGRPGTHVLPRPVESTPIQETTTSISAASCTVGDKQESEGRRGPTVLQKSLFCCPTNIPTALTNLAYGLSEGISLQPLTTLQRRLYDNQNNCDTAEMLANARSKATGSSTVKLQDYILGEDSRHVHSNRRQNLNPEEALFPFIPRLSSMKAFVTVLRYYVSFMILLLEIFKPERTRSEQSVHLYSYGREEKNCSVMLNVSARLGYVCKTGARNWRSSFVWGP
ncbi:hypothetical protein Cfor_00108, partial [Coptotermes formosanus]